MWLMLQQKTPDDYVIATGKTHSVREFTTTAFAYAGIKLEWFGSGLQEKGFDKKTGKPLVFVHPRYFRPTEVNLLIGDASKAHRQLNWHPKITLEQLVKLMVEADCKKVERKLVQKSNMLSTNTPLRGVSRTQKEK